MISINSKFFRTAQKFLQYGIVNKTVQTPEYLKSIGIECQRCIIARITSSTSKYVTARQLKLLPDCSYFREKKNNTLLWLKLHTMNYILNKVDTLTVEMYIELLNF